ncbi:MAG: DMT family transporter [Bradymonadia bacterium]
MKKVILSSHQAGLFVATLAISTAAPLFRQIGDIEPLLAASLRLLFAGVILLLIGGHRFNQLDTEKLKGALLCAVFYALHFGAWVTSLQYTTIAASVTLVTTTPIMLLCLSFFRGLPVQKSQGLSCLVALIGVIFIVGADWQTSSDALWGDLLALIGAMAMAGYFLVVKPLNELPLRPFMCLTALVSGTLLLFICWVSSPNALQTVDSSHLQWLAILALGPHLIGHGLLTWSLRSTTSTSVALATVGEPAGSAILAYIFFGEFITAWAMLGCALTLGAIYLGTRQSQPG